MSHCLPINPRQIGDEAVRAYEAAGKGILARSNAEQVERIVTIAHQMSIEPATPHEASRILGLKVLDKVSW